MPVRTVAVSGDKDNDSLPIWENALETERMPTDSRRVEIVTSVCMCNATRTHWNCRDRSYTYDTCTKAILTWPFTYIWMDGWMDGLRDGWVGAWMDRNGKMSRWMQRRMDGYDDG